MSRIAAALALWWVLTSLSCGRKAGQPSARPTPTSTPTPDASDAGVRNEATGAVQALPESALAGRHVQSAIELLEGRVAGLQIIRQPNGDLELRIRGAPNSLLDGGEPLLVIDGMPVASGNVSRALTGLKPHEIATIEVLKDVSSTSIYGLRGANGVILLTTKRE